MLVTVSESGPAYQPMWILVSAGIAITCLLYFANLQPCVDESDVDRIDVDDHTIIDPSTALAV